jgi:hypothetical protein
MILFVNMGTSNQVLDNVLLATRGFMSKSLVQFLEGTDWQARVGNEIIGNSRVEGVDEFRCG